MSTVTGLKNKKAGIAVIILLIVIIALAAILYLRPEIKDNPLFIALGFIATVAPFLFLLWQQYNSENNSKEHREEQPREIPSQIEAPPEDFTGRTKDIEDLLAKFDRGATITGLRGMGGIGKTALALVLAQRLKPRFPDGQLFVNLLGTSKSPLKPADAMAHVIRSYKGVDALLPDDQNELAGLYRTMLSSKKALILLDNAANRQQVELLLPPSDSGCALIVTSREKFVLSGLEEKDLDVLPLDEAKKLLLEIAKRIGDRAEDLAVLCDCLPIALKNAAYALKERKDLAVDKYLERLKDAKNRVDLVEASFSLSFDLLSADLQKLWSMLSVFPDDFDRESAAAVWENDLDFAYQALSDLVKMSLVEYREASDRYFLHDLASDFVASRLETAAKAAAEQRHAEHYRAILSSANELYLKGDEGILAGLVLFDLEEVNIMAGQAWAAKNLKTNSSAAKVCSSYPDSGVYVLDLRLHPLQKIAWLEKGLEAAKSLKDRAVEGAHLGNLGSAYADLGDARKAIEFHEQALVIDREIGDRRGEGTDLGNLGSAYADLGDVRKAIEFYEQHLAIAREIGNRRGEGSALWNMSLSQDKLGQRKEAISNAKSALKIYEQIESPHAKIVRQALAQWQ